MADHKKIASKKETVWKSQNIVHVFAVLIDKAFKVVVMIHIRFDI